MWGYKCKTCDIIWGYECKTCLGNTWENMDGANGQTGGKNSSSTFVLTAFISFGLFNIPKDNAQYGESTSMHVNKNYFCNFQWENSFQVQ